jgi:hypothetical protein
MKQLMTPQEELQIIEYCGFGNKPKLVPVFLLLEVEQLRAFKVLRQLTEIEEGEHACDRAAEAEDFPSAMKTRSPELRRTPRCAFPPSRARSRLTTRTVSPRGSAGGI